MKNSLRVETGGCFNLVLYKKWRKKSGKWKVDFWDVLPKKGRRPVSALATTLGPPRKTTGSASKKLECGARARIGASFEVACVPLTFKLWNPPQTNSALITQHTKIRISLFKVMFHFYYNLQLYPKHLCFERTVFLVFSFVSFSTQVCSNHTHFFNKQLIHYAYTKFFVWYCFKK